MCPRFKFLLPQRASGSWSASLLLGGSAVGRLREPGQPGFKPSSVIYELFLLKLLSRFSP